MRETYETITGPPFLGHRKETAGETAAREEEERRLAIEEKRREKWEAKAGRSWGPGISGENSQMLRNQ